jgi:hypothetical protein
MKVDPDSFRGKILILLVDKIVIGAIIGVVLLTYDRWRVIDARHAEQQVRTIQLEFERAKLFREFLPVITSSDGDLVSRAYILRSAVLTGAIDPETGIEIAREFILRGLAAEHFRRVVSAAMPSGIPAIARRAEIISSQYEQQFGHRLQPSASYNPVSGREDIPQDEAPLLLEARAWRDSIREALPALGGDGRLNNLSDLAPLLPGLFLLLNPGDSFEARRLSVHPSRGIQAIGNVGRIRFDPGDAVAAEQIGTQLTGDLLSDDGLRYAAALISILRRAHLSGGRISQQVARIVVYDPGRSRRSSENSAMLYWLRFNAAELLLEMQQAARTTRLNGARDAEATLVRFLDDFRDQVARANSQEQVDRVAQIHESGEIVRVVVRVVREFGTQPAQASLLHLRNFGPDKLRHFPFLEADLSSPQ